MALNWAMLSEDGSRPVPLPGEKVYFSVEKCSISLDFKQQGVKWAANGNAFVTSQRVVFVRQPPLPAPADPSLSSAHLRSLSVPLSQFVDTRYLIPVFTAPYFEARVVPSRDGGLPFNAPHQSDAPNTAGLCKIWFNEGGGMAFRDAVEEVKSRLDEGSTHIEALPLYQPREEAEASTSSMPNIDGLQIDGQQSSRLAPPRTTRPARSDSMPQPEDMEAAQVAQEAEERERDVERQQSQLSQIVQASRPPDANLTGTHVLSQEPEEQPPPYPA